MEKIRSGFTAGARNKRHNGTCNTTFTMAAYPVRIAAVIEFVFDPIPCGMIAGAIRDDALDPDAKCCTTTTHNASRYSASIFPALHLLRRHENFATTYLS